MQSSSWSASASVPTTTARFQPMKMTRILLISTIALLVPASGQLRVAPAHEKVLSKFLIRDYPVRVEITSPTDGNAVVGEYVCSRSLLREWKDTKTTPRLTYRIIDRKTGKNIDVKTTTEAQWSMPVRTAWTLQLREVDWWETGETIVMQLKPRPVPIPQKPARTQWPPPSWEKQQPARRLNNTRSERTTLPQNLAPRATSREMAPTYQDTRQWQPTPPRRQQENLNTQRRQSTQAPVVQAPVPASVAYKSVICSIYVKEAREYVEVPGLSKRSKHADIQIAPPTRGQTYMVDVEDVEGNWFRYLTDTPPLTTR